MSTITTFLQKDRVRCDCLFQAADDAVRRQFWRKAGPAIDRFASALNRHLAMEEDVLFTALAQYTGEAGKPIAVLLREHRQLRQLAIRARSAVRRRNAREFTDVAAGLQCAMEDHCMKEEGIVLAMADHFLRPAARFLVEAMQSLRQKARLDRIVPGTARAA
jgi:iron-sulfur cluster repair protein YtfE (RIC family)